MGEQSDFKTLLQEEKERTKKPVTVQGVDRAWWRREKSYYHSCPHIDENVCVPSRKYRSLGPFICGGSWYQGCQIYIRIKNNGGDPEVLAVEG